MLSTISLESSVRRILVEKRQGFDLEAKALKKDLIESLHIDTIENVRILNRYDIEGIDGEVYENAAKTIFSEPNLDIVYHETLEFNEGERVFAIEYLPGQYDQRGDWAAQCIQIVNEGNRPEINTAKLYILTGNITDEQFDKIKDYIINPVDSREASLEKPESLKMETEVPTEVEILDGFIDLNEEGLKVFLKNNGLAMTLGDLAHVQGYFKNTEKRNPTITEIKVLDTYWSDHCRHTTFMTEIEDVKIESGKYTDIIKEAYDMYLESRKNVYIDRQKDICLMDIATIAMKELRKQGKLEDLDVSEEINACSINVDVEIDGKVEPYLVMFKNETHNHPTEIEPFGGAATCLGGAIRDPLSGRSYVYQAMRVTGSADPRTTLEDTLPGKLMQRKITTEAAHGYSSYGNQIGLTTGQVAEVYDGTVEIKSIAREAGSRTKIAVASNDPNVDPVGACVGINGARVNAIVSDLRGEKIDIIEWNDDPAVLIENALSPSNVVSVDVDEEEKSARVVVPDYQLSLAIGKEGQNARLAAKLTGYKIDIKSESQAAELAEELDFGEDFGDLDEAEDFDLEAPVEEPEVSASEATADFEAEEVTEEPETAEDSFEEVSSEEADTDEQ